MEYENLLCDKLLNIATQKSIKINTEEIHKLKNTYINYFCTLIHFIFINEEFWTHVYTKFFV